MIRPANGSVHIEIKQLRPEKATFVILPGIYGSPWPAYELIREHPEIGSILMVHYPNDPGALFLPSAVSSELTKTLAGLGATGIHVLGVSLGGLVAVDILEELELRVLGLVLCNTPCGLASLSKEWAEKYKVFQDHIPLSVRELKSLQRHLTQLPQPAPLEKDADTGLIGQEYVYARQEMAESFRAKVVYIGQWGMTQRKLQALQDPQLACLFIQSGRDEIVLPETWAHWQNLVPTIKHLTGAMLPHEGFCLAPRAWKTMLLTAVDQLLM